MERAQAVRSTRSSKPDLNSLIPARVSRTVKESPLAPIPHHHHRLLGPRYHIRAARVLDNTVRLHERIGQATPARSTPVEAMPSARTSVTNSPTPSKHAEPDIETGLAPTATLANNQAPATNESGLIPPGTRRVE